LSFQSLFCWILVLDECNFTALHIVLFSFNPCSVGFWF